MQSPFAVGVTMGWLAVHHLFLHPLGMTKLRRGIAHRCARVGSHIPCRETILESLDRKYLSPMGDTSKKGRSSEEIEETAERLFRRYPAHKRAILEAAEIRVYGKPDAARVSFGLPFLGLGWRVRNTMTPGEVGAEKDEGHNLCSGDARGGT